jgi:sulfoxide reductase catalytic subunit YedY
LASYLALHPTKMFIHETNPLAPQGGKETPEGVFLNRRRWLQLAGVAAGSIAAGAGYLLWRGAVSGEDEAVIAAGRWSPAAEAKYAPFYPARRDERFAYERQETVSAEAARYTNFYEFSSYKWCWRFVRPFQPDPWTLTVDGLCRNPLKLDLEDFHRQFRGDLVERQYRHRCVEKWAMAVPWTGIPLAAILQAADPLAQATHVRFVSFQRPEQAAHQATGDSYPWPYTEGLTIAEAMNELTLVATGVYGRPLLKQHGAPLRLVVPWKYGYKSIKSIERIELIGREPATFWSTLNPAAYPFESNVDPAIPRPWDQSTERMLGTGETFSTQKYNGYAKWVAGMYTT